MRLLFAGHPGGKSKWFLHPSSPGSKSVWHKGHRLYFSAGLATRQSFLAMWASYSSLWTGSSHRGHAVKRPPNSVKTALKQR